MPGADNLILTGSLGDVLKESAQAALSFIKSNAKMFNISPDFFKSHDIHIHVPAGAIPKDGPSAGIPIFAALISLVTNKKCKRDVALTGEITLSGRILPVAGIREKLLAAKNAGIKTVIFPERNKSDFNSIPESITSGLKIIFIRELCEVMKVIFV
jgi:ATP-dependent Lon protease